MIKNFTGEVPVEHIKLFARYFCTSFNFRAKEHRSETNIHDGRLIQLSRKCMLRASE